MADLTRADVAHLAMLARIDLRDEELDQLAGDLRVILDAVAKVSAAPIEGVEPMSHPLPLVNVTRPDQVVTPLTAHQALGGAPQMMEQRFAVPRILDED